MPKPFILLLAVVLVSVRGLTQTPTPGPSPAALVPVLPTDHGLPPTPAASPAAPTPPPAPADPKADTLVDCGKEKAVILGHTETRDGAYALGWTLHRHRARCPVDWKAYDHADPNTFIAKYSTRDDLAPGDYALIDGVLDLRAKRFVPLPTTEPYYPNKPDVTLHVAWSDDEQGTRFALVGNDGSPRTFNLWLIEASPRRLRAEDRAPAADRAVWGFLRKQGVKTPGDYHVSFAPTPPSAGTKPTSVPFKGTVLEIPFRAQVPRADNLPQFSGTLTMTLAGGKVTGVQGKKIIP